MIGGMTIYQVDPGTVITDHATGEKLTVTDTEAVVKGSKMWVTPAHYEAIKAAYIPTGGLPPAPAQKGEAT